MTLPAHQRCRALHNLQVLSSVTRVVCLGGMPPDRNSFCGTTHRKLETQELHVMGRCSARLRRWTTPAWSARSATPFCSSARPLTPSTSCRQGFQDFVHLAALLVSRLVFDCSAMRMCHTNASQDPWCFYR